MSFAFAIAWLLPLAAGIALWLALVPRRGPGWLAAAGGHGIVFGMLLAAACVDLFARADTAHAWTRAAWPLAVFAVLAAIVAWRRSRPSSASEEGELITKLETVRVERSGVQLREVETRRVSELSALRLRFATLRANGVFKSIPNKPIILLLAIALVSLGFRGWLMLREIWLRPTFPWDAWDAWAVKSKTWFLLGHYAPFVSMSDWLAHPARELYTGVAWAYPATLAWIQVWFASAAGGWIEPQVNLPWFALWIGLLLGHYGQWRALGSSRVLALAATYALGSLPLLDVHVALAGYADLWLAAMLGFAALAWLRWRRERDAGQLVVAIVCAALLPAIKLEGAIWLLLCVAVAVYDVLPRRWRRLTMAGAVAALLLLAFLRHIALPVPGLGWVRITHSAIVVPALGEYALRFNADALLSLLNSLFVQPNWHLLWWLAPGIALWRWRALREDAALRHLGAFVLLGFAFLLFLFTCTDASRWAESYTAVNRLILQLVPATITALTLMCRAPEPACTHSLPAAQPDPA